MTVAMARSHHRAIGHDGVLDVHVGDAVMELLVGLRGIHAALDEVSRVEGEAHAVAEVIQQVDAALGHIAVDLLLVIMHQLNTGLLGQIQHDGQAVDDLLPPISGIAARGREEAEHADALAAQVLAQLQTVAEQRQMLVKGFVQGSLAVGRAQGGQGNAGSVQPGLHRVGLLQGQLGAVLAVHAAQFNQADAFLLERLQLLVQRGAGLIREG